MDLTDWCYALCCFSSTSTFKMRMYKALVCECADDSKIGDIIDSEEGYQHLHQDLDPLGKWADERQIEFNDKCEALQVGKSNYRTFTMISWSLGSAVEQRD